jgi:hypothetical protein
MPSLQIQLTGNFWLSVVNYLDGKASKPPHTHITSQLHTPLLRATLGRGGQYTHLDRGQGVAQRAYDGRHLKRAAEARRRAQHGTPEQCQRMRVPRRGRLGALAMPCGSVCRRRLRLHGRGAVLQGVFTGWLSLSAKIIVHGS